MIDWRDLVKTGNFAEAEESMLAETAAPEGYFPDNETRGDFYELWGDTLADENEKKDKYEVALMNWQMFASCSTSGGEGTARMMDVTRVLEKIEKVGIEN